jgi:hypothetical protein
MAVNREPRTSLIARVSLEKLATHVGQQVHDLGREPIQSRRQLFYRGHLCFESL